MLGVGGAAEIKLSELRTEPWTNQRQIADRLPPSVEERSGSGHHRMMEF